MGARGKQGTIPVRALAVVTALAAFVPASAPARPDVIATVGVGVRPWGVAVDSAADRVYVANFAGPGAPGSVSVVEGASGSVVTTVPVGAGPVGVAVDAAAGRVYAASAVAESVTIIDAGSGAVLATVPGLVTGPYGIAANAGTGRAYAGNFDPDAPGLVWVIDGASALVAAIIAVGPGPHHVAADAVANQIFVTNAGAGTVSVIDGAADAVVATIGVGANPQGIAVDDSTNRAYVANRDSDTISVIDGAALTIVATLSVADRPTGVAVDQGSGRLYVTHDAPENRVTVLDAASGAFVAGIASGPVPRGVAADPASGRAYVSNFGGHTLSIIDAVPPPAPVIIRPAAGGFAGAPATIAGESVPGATVEVFEGVTLVGATVASGTGIWAVAVPLAPGPHTVTARATDASGDVSAPSAPQGFTVDVVPPATAITTPAGSIVVSAPLVGTPVSGTASDLVAGIATVTVIFDPLIGPAISVEAMVTCTDSVTRLSCTWTARPPLLPGIYGVGARAADRAGNLDLPGPAVAPILVV